MTTSARPGPGTQGIHHVTAICGDPQRNVDFYAGVLGLRPVKKTVNFDDPTSYHLYYGDERGRPGTIMTFFAWPGAGGGRRGTGQVTAVRFRIPAGSARWWKERLGRHGTDAETAHDRPAEEALSFRDPDGLALELVGRPDYEGSGHSWPDGPVPAEHAIRGFHGVTITSAGREPTAELLEATLGFEMAGETGDRLRFVATGSSEVGIPGTHVDVLSEPGAPPGRVAVGAVHHVAFRARDEAEQVAWRRRVVEAGLEVTRVIDRRYFRSIYFREPGGVLFEIATDGPGFTEDEPAERLGSELALPPWLEGRRAELERSVPPLRDPDPGRVSA